MAGRILWYGVLNKRSKRYKFQIEKAMIVGPLVHWLAVGIVRFDKREKLSDKREKLTKLIFVSY